MALRHIPISVPLLLCAAVCGLQCAPAKPTGATSDSSDRPDSKAERGKPSQAGAPPSPVSALHFAQVDPQQAGIGFRHVSGNAVDKPFPAANGSGVGALDYDLDGRYDLYFATGRSFPLDSGRGPANRFYRNRGEWRFEDVTQATDLGHRGFSAGVAVADFDGDGFPDVYVGCYGRNRLFHNLGDGTFEEVGRAAGADDSRWAASVAFLDYNSDGLPDIYVCHYAKWDYAHNAFCGDRAKNVRIFCSPRTVPAEADLLLQNEGDGTFRDVTAQRGLSKRSGRGQGVLAADVDGDGRIDLYVGNDIHPNALYLNRGEAGFEDVSEASGTSYDSLGRMQAGMGVAGADVNRDGLWDLFVTNFEGEFNALYLQGTDGLFQDVCQMRGLAADSRPWIGWGTAFVDFDLDGWKDLIVTNGHVDDNLKQIGRDVPYDEPPLVWANRKGRFVLLGDAAGDYFRTSHPGRGLATADLDNDGDVDVVITHQDRPPGLLRNERIVSGRSSRASATLRLIGTRSNRDAIGARIEIESDAEPRVEQIQGGGSYLSAHDLRLVVAAEGELPLNLKIRWPSGTTTPLRNIEPGRQYDVIEPADPSGRAAIFRR